MRKKTKIFIAGSINFDFVAKSDRFPKEGETLLGDEFGTFQGGKGANQAIQARKLGADVFFLGKVGRDYFGKILIENLKKQKIDTRYIISDKNVRTGCAIILVDRHGNNSIVVIPGANMALKKNEFDRIKNLFLKCDLVLMQLEIPLNLVLYISEFANKNNIPVVLNPAPASVIPDSLIKRCFILTPNESEIKILTGIDNIEEGADGLMNKGTENVIVTLGEKGCLWVNRHEKRYFPAFRINAVDTTAAGDAFNGGFVVALANGGDIPRSIIFANACGALSATKIGASVSLPNKSEVESFLKKKVI